MFSIKTIALWFKPRTGYQYLFSEPPQRSELPETPEKEKEPSEILGLDGSQLSLLASSTGSLRPRSTMILTLSLILLGLLLTLTGIHVMRQARSHHETTYPSLHSSSELQSRLLLGSSHWNSSSPSPCGHSVDSARAAGCKFSPMVWAWYPPACYDNELEQEFLSIPGWEYYTTKELKEQDRIAREEVERGDHPKVYTNLSYHRNHCVYSAMKLLRSFLGVTLSDNYVLSMSHMEHCKGFLVQDRVVTWVRGVAKYLDCVAP